MAQTRQSRSDSGLGFQLKVPKTFEGVLSSLGGGALQHAAAPQSHIMVEPMVDYGRAGCTIIGEAMLSR